jgi:hypothetical protein
LFCPCFEIVHACVVQTLVYSWRLSIGKHDHAAPSRRRFRLVLLRVRQRCDARARHPRRRRRHPQGSDAGEGKFVRADLETALKAGYAVLKDGGSSLDAVGKAIVVLEDSPRFNAGKGAVFTHDGRNELDAAIMDGATMRAGAIAGVHRVKNPVLLARRHGQIAARVHGRRRRGSIREASASNSSIPRTSAPTNAGNNCRTHSRRKPPSSNPRSAA